MKSVIQLSRFSVILTVSIFLLLFVGGIVKVHDKPEFFILLAVYLILVICAIFFGTAYIKADNNYVVLGSMLKKKKILVRDIESVERFQPTMGAIRVCGSGGFMGYWGIFKEGDIGRYYAFYGKSSDCFLIRMKNGDKYVIGCKEPDKMVEFLQSVIQQ